MKTCSTCFTEIEDITKLEYIGLQECRPYLNYDLEMYNCSCGSTITHRKYAEKPATKEPAEKLVNE